jgi:hypothetical protein
MPPRASFRTDTGDLLTEDDIARAIALPESGDIELDDGRTIRARTYTLTGVDGRFKEVFGHPRNYALDDYLYIIDVHWIEGDTLYRGMVEVGGPGGIYRQTLTSATKCLTGLTRMS